jgi:hypothetical protein
MMQIALLIPIAATLAFALAMQARAVAKRQRRVLVPLVLCDDRSKPAGRPSSA